MFINHLIKRTLRHELFSPCVVGANSGKKKFQVNVCTW